MRLRSSCPQTPIRICPDWNVKPKKLIYISVSDFIRICPDWNVKVTNDKIFTTVVELEYVQIGM